MNIMTSIKKYIDNDYVFTDDLGKYSFPYILSKAYLKVYDEK
ncbi:hypothetical protein SDC9_41629 [bioreactor metagenome]|jgi:hypothetical protein|uniref:Uncharacterized protein n=1 Tax=bioreactor metagenome TaxID=1076179 RepID=A0A644VVQ5_9ZZZZ